MTVRVQPGRKPSCGELRSRLEGLERLPIRATTARQFMGVVPVELDAYDPVDLSWTRSRGVAELDPGWVLQDLLGRGTTDPLEVLAETSWWPASNAGNPTAEAFQRLWRHSVAVGLAARSLAREAGDPEPEQLVRVGLLHGLGRWAVACVDPDWLVRWLNEPDRRTREGLERRDLGTDLCNLGRRLAERWGCSPLVADAAWLHDQTGDLLNRAATAPARLRLIQQAYRWAESTPWALATTGDRDVLPTEPRLRILIAEVQSRCGALFAAVDATAHEERMTRQCARLRLRLNAQQHDRASQDRLLRALADADPAESRERWAERAGALWCEEPEVTAARVVWIDSSARESNNEHTDGSAETSGLEIRTPPSVIFPLAVRGRARARVELWVDPAQPDIRQRIRSSSLLDAWSFWASAVADRGLLEQRLQAVAAAVRELGDEEPRVREGRLQGLAEFAAGAGHELNNPLAVIVGRAQLLLGRSSDPEVVRSLGIILNQAQRTHRILRDLMYVARPPAPRPRACRPAEVLRGCVNGAQDECEARGIRLVGEFDQAETTTWTDPDGLHHLAETLLRNAIQATPSGGKIQVRSGRSGDELRWSFIDGGKGITAAEGSLIFDPFYCGRQAGRGLGLGLPRASRLANLLGGVLHWSSTPGQGSVFQVHLPLKPPPEQVGGEGAGEPGLPSRPSQILL